MLKNFATKFMLYGITSKAQQKQIHENVNEESMSIHYSDDLEE